MSDFRGIEKIVYALRAFIKLRNGTTVEILEEDVSSYNPNTSMSSQCIPIGAVSATAYSLVFNNQNYGLKPEELDGAEVRVQVSEGENVEWKDFGVWFVESMEVSEQDAFATISGSDALSNKFNAKWTDTKKDYPRNLQLIVNTIRSIAGVELATPEFKNWDYVVSKMPDWNADITIRDILSHVAVCASGFARINYSGKLEIMTIGKTERHIADSDYYSRYSAAGRFKFNCLQYEFDTDPDKDKTKDECIAVDPNVENNATNTIQLSGNPLIEEAMANSENKMKALLNSIAEPLQNISYEGASISWFGGSDVLPGDELKLITTDGKEHILILNNYSLNMGGGMSSEATSDMPSVISETGYYSQSPSVFNPDGTINVEAVSGLDQKVISADTAYFNNLTAENVQASKLLAAMIQATTVKAKSISTENIETDMLTAMFAEIINATIKKLDAGSITTDELYAAVADIVGLKVKNLTASDINTDRLASALAKFTVVTAENAEFGTASAKNLVANLFNLTGEAVMDDVFIHNLKIAYAQMVSASIGNLVLQASNGNYYQIDVNQKGEVSTTQVYPSEAEENEGVFGETRPIIATQMTVDDMGAKNIKAIHMLVNKIDAARIDTDELFANKAFITHLNTADISNNETISIISGKVDDLPIRTDFTQKAVIISDAEGASSVRIDSKSVNVGTVYGAGQGFSKLAANYVQFGNHQMRRTSDGGLAFKLGGEVIWQQ